jgi:hypothetical protein
MLSVLSERAEVERETIRARVDEGRAPLGVEDVPARCLPRLLTPDHQAGARKQRGARKESIEQIARMDAVSRLTTQLPAR